MNFFYKNMLHIIIIFWYSCLYKILFILLNIHKLEAIFCLKNLVIILLQWNSLLTFTNVIGKNWIYDVIWCFAQLIHGQARCNFESTIRIFFPKIKNWCTVLLLIYYKVFLFESTIAKNFFFFFLCTIESTKLQHN